MTPDWNEHHRRKNREAYLDAIRWIFYDGDGEVPLEDACDLAGVAIERVRSEARRRLRGERRDVRQHIKGHVPARTHFAISVIRRALRDLELDVDLEPPPSVLSPPTEMQ